MKYSTRTHFNKTWYYVCVFVCVCVCVCTFKMILLTVLEVSTNSDCLFNDTISNSEYSVDRMAVNNELKRKSQKAVEAYFKAVFRHLSLLPTRLLHCANLRNETRWGSLHI